MYVLDNQIIVVCNFQPHYPALLYSIISRENQFLLKNERQRGRIYSTKVKSTDSTEIKEISAYLPSAKYVNKDLLQLDVNDKNLISIQVCSRNVTSYADEIDYFLSNSGSISKVAGFKIPTSYQELFILRELGINIVDEERLYEILVQNPYWFDDSGTSIPLIDSDTPKRGRNFLRNLLYTDSEISNINDDTPITSPLYIIQVSVDVGMIPLNYHSRIKINPYVAIKKITGTYIEPGSI